MDVATAPDARHRWAAVIALTAAIVVLPFLLVGPQIEAAIEAWLPTPPPGLFAGGCVALLAIDSVAPVPSSVVAVAAGARLGAVVGTAVVFVGLQLGATVAWGCGRVFGDPFVRRFVGERDQERGRAWLEQPGGLLLLALSRPVPVLAEATSILAGAVQVPFGRFFLIVAASNLGVAAYYAVIGATVHSAGSLLVAIGGAAVLPGVGLLVWRRSA